MLNVNFHHLFIQIIQLLRYAIILCMVIFPFYAYSAVSIESGFYQSNIELYYKSDLFSTKGGSSRIFWIQLNNDGASKAVAISIEIVNKNGARVLSGRTKYFTLSASQNLFLSNLDLSYMHHPYGIESFEWFNESENLQRGLHNAGRLPSDEYIFV